MKEKHQFLSSCLVNEQLLLNSVLESGTLVWKQHASGSMSLVSRCWTRRKVSRPHALEVYHILRMQMSY